MKHELMYVVGDVHRALRRGEHHFGRFFVVSGRSGDKSNLPRKNLPVPDHLLYEDGSWISLSKVGAKEMRRALQEIRRDEPITIIDRLL